MRSDRPTRRCYDNERLSQQPNGISSQCLRLCTALLFSCDVIKHYYFIVRFSGGSECRIQILRGCGRVGHWSGPSAGQIGSVRIWSGWVTKNMSWMRRLKIQYMCNLYARNRLFVIPIRSCNITIYYRLLRYSNLVVESDVLDENGFCILMVAEMICFLLVLTRQNITFFDN